MDVNPLRTAPFVLVALGLLVIAQVWRRRHLKERVPTEPYVLIAVAAFGLVSISRVVFALSLETPYTMFTAPVVILVYVYAFQRLAPAILLTSSTSRVYARRSAAAILAVTAAVLWLLQRLGTFVFATTWKSALRAAAC